MKRSKCGLSNYKLYDCFMGNLVPIGLTEVVAGDTIQHATSMLVRVAPMNLPVMHPVHVRIHHWFVPTRIIWEDWEDFITGGPDGFNASVFPTIDFTGGVPGGVGGLADFLGIDPTITNAQAAVVSALPFRAYQLVFKEWYRDQDLVTAPAISVASGPDVTTSTSLHNCAWEKDYFTTSRPWTQKGPSVRLPIGTTAPVTGTGSAAVPSVPTGLLDPLGNPIDLTLDPSGGSLNQLGVQSPPPAGDLPGPTIIHGITAPTAAPVGPGSFVADLSSATAVSINELRQALALQRYEEARARYGSRYTEYLRYLGIKSSDARLQRPEYLGGGKQTIQFSEVLQTAPGGTPAVGSLFGHGIAAVRSNRYRRFFEEHGFIITMASVLPKTMYGQSLARHWWYRTKEDFFQKELQFIGQQEVFNREFYAGHANPGGIFGYQDRYDHLRRQESTIAGNMRGSLDAFHMARLFAGGTGALNAAFVTADPTTRINQVTNAPNLWVMANHNMQARRIVSQSATPRTF